jgi:hypothetical protein
MKYENFQEADKIVSQILKYQTMINDLENSGSDLYIRIEDKYDEAFYTINTGNSSEHEYAPLGRKLIIDIKSDLQKKIDNLKSMLEQL